MHGRSEGRVGTPFSAHHFRKLKNLNRDRETIILLVHETSRTGAPILGLNLLKKLKSQWGFNVVVISSRGGGTLEQAFQEEADLFFSPPAHQILTAFEMEWIATRLVELTRPRYCIANSSATHEMALTLALRDVPVIGLVHEFTSHLNPTQALRDYFFHLEAIIFPTEIVYASALQSYPFLSNRRTYIYPQGQCIAPDLGASAAAETLSSSAGTLLKWSAPKHFTVAGLGTVEWRKGVDIFVATAAMFRRHSPCVSCNFLWIGDPANHSTEATLYLKEQLARSDLNDSVVFLPATSNLDNVYASIDLLYVSSRLDPLPNVAIDAMLKGIPVVSFDKATGIADALRAKEKLSFLIAPYMDAYAASKIIHELATDKEKFAQIKSLIRDIALDLFDMDRYVSNIDTIARQISPKKSNP